MSMWRAVQLSRCTSTVSPQLDFSTRKGVQRYGGRPQNEIMVKDDDEDRRERILRHVVAAKGRPLRALDIGRSLSIGKGAVNTVLYELDSLKRVQRTVENPPYWTICETTSRNASSFDDNETDASRVERILLGNKMEGMSSASLAYSMKVGTSTVNKILYNLEKKRRVERVQTSPPVWRIVSGGAQSREKHRARVTDAESDGTTTSSPNSTGRSSPVQERQRKRQRATAKTAVKSVPEIIAACQEIHKKPSKSAVVAKDQSWATTCKDLVWKKFRALKAHQTINEPNRREVVAGFIIRIPDGSSPRVVALGSGSKILGGDQFSLKGRVVHDSHAEIVARRGLIRWLYHQIATAGTNGSLAVLRDANGGRRLFELLPFDLWLYISLAPCGDSAIFSRSDPAPTASSCWTSSNHGMLRVKEEASRGAVLTSESTQSMGGLQLGDRATSQSCSDKVALWNVVGVQGALLSRLVDPVFIKGVVIGDAFSHGHICRAICCRSQVALDSTATKSTGLSEVYLQSHHPRILHHPTETQRADAIAKLSDFSYNWAEQDKGIERVLCRTGLVDNASKVPARISKAALFSSFCRSMPAAASVTYTENKKMSNGYKEAKHAWVKAMMTQYKKGSWKFKLSDFGDFCLTE
jgi:DNA-binding CsgD family transcriptional regulator